MHCPPLDNWSGLITNTSQTTYKTSVNVSCDIDKNKRNGQFQQLVVEWSVITCEEDGLWSPPVPKCNGKLATFTVTLYQYYKENTNIF